MRSISMTFGVMPTFEQFEAAFTRECPHGTYAVTPGMGPDPVMEAAAGEHTCRELYALVERMKDDDTGEPDDDSPARLAADIMGTLGFEWI